MSTPRRFTVRNADYTADFKSLQAIREPVFIAEQGFPIEEEWDHLDPLSRHVIAEDEAGRPIGTGRLTPELKIGRMAVVPEWRGAGVGAEVLSALIRIARTVGYPRVSLHSQMHAIPFYARAGFKPVGEPFDECGAPHQDMVLDLAPVFEPGAVHTLDRAADVRALATTIARSARHGLLIASRELEFDLYDHDDFVDAVKTVAINGRNVCVRLLVDDIRTAVERDHRLVHLAQRLSSKIEVRRPNIEWSGTDRAALVLNDTGGWMKRNDPTRYDAEGALADRPRQRELQIAFDRIWEHADPETRFRTLKI